MPAARSSKPDTKPWFVYVLRCRDGSLYTGATNDLARRIEQHGSGKGAAYTRSHRPVTLAWSEQVGDRGAALRREAAIKRMSRQEKLRMVEEWDRPAVAPP
jgi:putative endonuclease